MTHPPEPDRRPRRSRWPLYLLRLLAALILLSVFARSLVDGAIGTIYKNVAEPLDKELPVTVTSFRSAANVVSTLGGRGEGLNCSMPWGIDLLFTPRLDVLADALEAKHGDQAGRRKPELDDPASSVPVRQRFRQACVFHDLCYRHGLATYGYSQSDCDELLQEHALRICIWASRNQKRLSQCQLDAKKVTAGVRLMGWYDAYRDWGESTYFEFDPNPYRSRRFYATRAIDHPLKATSTAPQSEPDQALVRFETLPSGTRLTCLNCEDKSDKVEKAIGLPAGRQYSAPHLVVDGNGRPAFAWLARQTIDTSESCIAVSDPRNLLTDTHPAGPGCYDGANGKLGLAQVDLQSSAPQPSTVVGSSDGAAAPSNAVATGLTHQNGPLQICISRDIRSGQKPETRLRKNGRCYKLMDSAGNSILPNVRWLGAFQNFPVVRGGRHIYLARTVATESENDGAETIRLVDFIVTPQHMPGDAAAAPPGVILQNVKAFDIKDDFDPMLALTMNPADSRLITAKVVGDWWSKKRGRADYTLALYEIDLDAPDPQPAEIGIEAAENALKLHESWARRPILVTETGAEGEAKTELILSRSSTELVETEKSKGVGAAQIDRAWFEFAVLERPVAPTNPPAKFRLSRALACTATYTVSKADEVRIHPCERVTADVSSHRATPATYLQGAQLLSGQFGSGTEPLLALVDRCLPTQPAMTVRPVAIGAPVDEPAEVGSTRLRRLVECRPFGRAHHLAEPM